MAYLMTQSMQQFLPHLAWIDAQQACMTALVTSWSNVNSGTWNTDGVNRFGDMVRNELAAMACDVRAVDLPAQPWTEANGTVTSRAVGRALLAMARREAPLRVLLAIHLDTVYGAEDPFQQATH